MTSHRLPRLQTGRQSPCGNPLKPHRSDRGVLDYSLATRIAGVPRFSISIVSWTLHDVHDPQSPEPANTNCDGDAIRSYSAGASATATARLETISSVVVPNSALRALAKRSAKAWKFGFVLSMMPIRAPRSWANAGYVEAIAARTFPDGL